MKDDPVKSQYDRFIETARELGADEDPEAWRATLATIARQKPKADPPTQPNES